MFLRGGPGGGLEILVDLGRDVAVGHEGHRRTHDVHEQQLAPTALGHLHRALERGRRGPGEVGGVHDATDAAHRRTSLGWIGAGGSSTGAADGRSSRMGTVVPRRTDSATLPKTSRPKPVRPWVLMTMRSTLYTRAASMMAGAA